MKQTILRFELRTNRAFHGTHPIVARLYADKKNKYISTMFKVSASDWSPDKERTKENALINSYLDDLSMKFNKYIVEHPNSLELDHIAMVLFSERYKEKIKLLLYVSNFLFQKLSPNPA